MGHTLLISLSVFSTTCPVPPYIEFQVSTHPLQLTAGTLSPVIRLAMRGTTRSAATSWNKRGGSFWNMQIFSQKAGRPACVRAINIFVFLRRRRYKNIAPFQLKLVPERVLGACVYTFTQRLHDFTTRASMAQLMALSPLVNNAAAIEPRVTVYGTKFPHKAVG